MSALLPRLPAQQRLLWLFALVLLLPAVAIGWLGLRFLDQDRQLESRQRQERGEVAADRVVVDLEKAVAATERRLSASPPDVGIQPGDDAVVVTIGGDTVEASPAAHLLYTPTLPTAVEEPAAEFVEGEAFEIRARDYQRAAAAYRALTASPVEAVRAGALVRLGRTLRKMGRPLEALKVYDELTGLPHARVAGVPADLVARRARATLLQDLGRRDELHESALSLQADLTARRWLLDQGAYAHYAGQVREWLGSEPSDMAERQALSDAVDWLWRGLDGGSVAPTGRIARSQQKADVTVLWQSSGDRVVALVTGQRFREREWLSVLATGQTSRPFDVTLVDSAVAGPPEAGVSDGAVRRSSATTGLPWTVVLTEHPGTGDVDASASRRRVVIAGLALLVVTVIAGGYVVARGVARELAVARLQSDFVSAVSHEFRTPLTSLQQFTSILSEEDEPPAAKRRSFYQAQARATARLQRLVESLLDFGRMEAGAHPYRMERLSISPFLRDLVQAFRRDGAPDGFSVDCTADEECGDVTADREAIGRAIHNLLENAVKYAGDGRRIAVRAERRNGAVAISVQDEGLGIPPEELADVFTKFVRGAASRARGIKGTGIGLAMAREIVRAHGGDITVESAVGAGSTFTILLPHG